MHNALSDLPSEASSPRFPSGLSSCSGESAAFDLISDSDSCNSPAPSPKRPRFIEVFNARSVLRHKDSVVAAGIKLPKQDRPDTRTWRIDGVLRRAFGRETQLQGVQKSAHSSHRLAAVAVSEAVQELAEQALQQKVISPILRRPASTPWPFFIMLRKCDEQSATLHVDEAFSAELLRWGRENTRVGECSLPRRSTHYSQSSGTAGSTS